MQTSNDDNYNNSNKTLAQSVEENLSICKITNLHRNVYQNIKSCWLLFLLEIFFSLPFSSVVLPFLFIRSLRHLRVCFGYMLFFLLLFRSVVCDEVDIICCCCCVDVFSSIYCSFRLFFGRFLLHKHVFRTHISTRERERETERSHYYMNSFIKIYFR